MNYEQQMWLYAILCEHGFDEAVQAYKDNIATLGIDGKLAHHVGEEVANLDITTVNREEYVRDRLSECERTMRKMRNVANDDKLCDRYNVGSVIWNYVLAEAVRAALSERASVQTQPTAAVWQAANDEQQKEYSADLVKLFHGHAELIDELVGLSDDEIARKIKEWAAKRDKFGKALIENPKNNLRSKYARELKNAGIIHCTWKSFRAKL